MIPNPTASHTKDRGSGRGQLKFKRPGEQMREGQRGTNNLSHTFKESVVNPLSSLVFKTCHIAFRLLCAGVR